MCLFPLIRFPSFLIAPQCPLPRTSSFSSSTPSFPLHPVLFYFTVLAAADAAAAVPPAAAVPAAGALAVPVSSVDLSDSLCSYIYHAHVFSLLPSPLLLFYLLEFSFQVDGLSQPASQGES